MDIEKYCRHTHPDFWRVTLRNTDDVYFSSQYSLLDVIREMVAALPSAFLTRTAVPWSSISMRIRARPERRGDQAARGSRVALSSGSIGWHLGRCSP